MCPAQKKGQRPRASLEYLTSNIRHLTSTDQVPFLRMQSQEGLYGKMFQHTEKTNSYENQKIIYFLLSLLYFIDIYKYFYFFDVNAC